MVDRIHRRRGFTLLELLVAIGILAALSGLALVAVQKARRSAARTDCQDRLRQLGLAVLNYEASRGRLPPGAVQGAFEPVGVPDGVAHGMWPFLLGPLGAGPEAARYRLDRPYDAAANQPAAAARLAVLMCPVLDADRTEPWAAGSGGVTDFAPLQVNPFLADIGVLDPASNFEGPLPVNGTVRMTDITDGASNTILLGEAAGRPGTAWASPTNPVDLRQFFNGSGGAHVNGTNAGMADGAVRFLRDTTDLRVVGRMATRAGGEVVAE